MTVNDQTNEDTNPTASAPAAPESSGRKPAYILAREAAEQAEDEKQESKKKAAFLAASQGPQDKEEEGAEITGKAGLQAANPAVVPPVLGPNESTGDHFNPDLSGAGWITCSDGKKVRDDGVSIYAPGKKLSPGQIDMILQLSMQKGWTEIYAYEPGRNSLHQEATQMLTQMAAARQMPLKCCCEKKLAGSFASHLSDAEEAIRQVQMHRHNAAKSPAPSPA